MEGDQDPDVVPKKKHHPKKKQLYASILKQMEFYFSDAALSKDRFLCQLIGKDPYVPLDIFLTFNKIKSLTDNAGDIARALRGSTRLEISEDGTKVWIRTTRFWQLFLDRFYYCKTWFRWKESNPWFRTMWIRELFTWKVFRLPPICAGSQTFFKLTVLSLTFHYRDILNPTK